MSIRVLYSFPHKLGAARICYTAWQQVNGLVEAGCDVVCMPGALARPAPAGARVDTTLAWGKLRLPYKVLGTMSSLALHDRIVARRLRRMAGSVDIVHTWPSAAIETLQAAKELGVATVLERPNAHTRFAYEAVQAESRRLGITLPHDDEYFFKTDVLAREEEEFARADFLLCASDFTVNTFVQRGFPREKLLRHQYGYDESRFYPDPNRQNRNAGLRMLFAGVAAVRKGLHFALEAWLKSSACNTGEFLVAGNILPEYARVLRDMLAHPSIRVLGHRDDLPAIMRTCDLFTLPSIEEGFGLVIVEAMASGSVPLISAACTEMCLHGVHGFVHDVGDVESIRQQITTLDCDRGLLSKMRTTCLQAAPNLTWSAAGAKLAAVYKDAILRHTQNRLMVAHS